jgi:hypothetical protein
LLSFALTTKHQTQNQTKAKKTTATADYSDSAVPRGITPPLFLRDADANEDDESIAESHDSWIDKGDLDHDDTFYVYNAPPAEPPDPDPHATIPRDENQGTTRENEGIRSD